MERSRYRFLFAGVAAAALLVVLVSARKPVTGADPAMAPTTAMAAPKPISWLTVDEAAAKLQQEPKPVLIDLYTTWCGWCKQMDKKTYANKRVAEYLSDKFYTVKMDAETHNTVNWQGKSYAFDPQYRCNLFAVYLSHGRLEFPTTIIIVPGYEPQAIPGYMEPKEIEMLVKFFGEGAYRSKSFDEYQRSFHSSW